jgi:hypothetical protein
VSLIFKGAVGADEEIRRIIAKYYGYPGDLYELFMNIGREVLAVQHIKHNEKNLNNILLAEKYNDFKYNLYIPYTDKIRISKPKSRPQFESNEGNPVRQIVINGLTLHRASSEGLQAFKINDNAMEPFGRVIWSSQNHN